MTVGSGTMTFEVQGQMSGTSHPSQCGVLFRAQAKAASSHQCLKWLASFYQNLTEGQKSPRQLHSSTFHEDKQLEKDLISPLYSVDPSA